MRASLVYADLYRMGASDMKDSLKFISISIIIYAVLALIMVKLVMG